MDEYIDVLQRFGLQNEHELEELLNLFAQGFHIIFTNKTPKLRLVEEDPGDDKFIECAVALKCKFIISGDKALLAVQNYMGIKIDGLVKSRKTPFFVIPAKAGIQ